ncbi:hypothetical protein QFZ55_005997 [Streptomyces luteogriseus]|nr:hypothetical protein [Streptomyces luteogriseus]
MPQNGAMILILLPLPSFSGTAVFRVLRSSGRVNPAAEPFFEGMSGLTTFRATKAGRSFLASFPEVVPSVRPSCDPPQAASNGIPPATAAVATAVEARKLLRLGPEEAEAAFGVIASTLHGAPGHPAEAVGCGVSSGTG